MSGGVPLCVRGAHRLGRFQKLVTFDSKNKHFQTAVHAFIHFFNQTLIDALHR